MSQRTDGWNKEIQESSSHAASPHVTFNQSCFICVSIYCVSYNLIIQNDPMTEPQMGWRSRAIFRVQR
jgi:hypothetical protein